MARIQITRKQLDARLNQSVHLILLVIGLISCAVIYFFSSSLFSTNSTTTSFAEENGVLYMESDDWNRNCCRGVEHLELWGDAVKWGSEFKVKSSGECCRACKEMCKGVAGSCLCDSWVFCGDKEGCGPNYGECWLKKQKDTLDPDRRDSGDKVIWTSGLVFGKREGIIGLATYYGVLHIKLFPDCAPHSVSYILELLAARHCAGCEFYRAESRGNSWDSLGNHIDQAPFGPPYALIQGTLEARGTVFMNVPKEECPKIKRGSVAFIGSGPEFFISLADHYEWKQAYTVFGSVLPEDMEIAERIARLPTRLESWNNVSVSVLETPLPFLFQKIKPSYSKTDKLERLLR